MNNPYMTQEEMDIERQECEDAMREHEKTEMLNYTKVLKRVEKRVSASWYKSVLAFIDDGEYTYDFSIVDKPFGDRQKESGTRFGFIYIHQTSGGCPDGDDWYGQICIPIRGGLYLSYHYSS
jgi:hypothetical protein